MSALREAIKQAGKTQAEIAAQADISRTALQQFIRGDCKPSFEVLVRLCRVMNLSAEDLFPEHKWREGDGPDAA